MSDIWLTPAVPGTIPATQLGQFHELHTAVRRWIESSAAAQRNNHLLANLPYADLFFAFGLATLGDHPSANKLVEDARQVMEAPAPPQRDRQKDPDPVLVELVRRFLFKALRSRVLQATEGKPHTGPLAVEVRAELDEIDRAADQPPINNTHNLARYTIDRFRADMRVMEPSERVDVYASWTKRSNARTAVLPAQPKEEPLQLPPAEALTELTNPDCPLRATEYAALARSYVRSLGDATGGGLDTITELFRQLHPQRITNTFTTACHFSRLHLQLAEDAVFAACRFCLENPAPLIVQV